MILLARVCLFAFLILVIVLITKICLSTFTGSTDPPQEISSVPTEINSALETADSLFGATQKPTAEALDSLSEAAPILEATAHTFDYLALGDSLAMGIGTQTPASDGYVFRLRSLLESPLGLDQKINLINLAVSGETTHSMITNGQLDSAITELITNDVQLVTLDIGANDFLDLPRAEEFPRCFPDLNLSACFAAFQEVLESFEANLDSILALLRKEAGPDTTIALMTYYNPLHSGVSQPDYWPEECLPTISSIDKDTWVWLEYHLSNSIISNLLGNSNLSSISSWGLEGIPGTPISEGINDIIRRVATDHKAIVADLQPPSGPLLDFDDISADCIHADNSGHQAIANAFAGAILE